MTLLASMVIGFVLGLAYFGGLWLSVRRLLRDKRGPRLLNAARLLRLALFATVVALLVAHMGAYALGVLPGFWLARAYVIGRTREVWRGR